MESEKNNISKEFEEVWDLAQNYSYEPLQETEAAWERFSSKLPNSTAKKINLSWVSYAAAAVIFAVLGMGIYMLNTPSAIPAQSYSCGYAQMQPIQLPDGSRIDLGANSSLIIAEDFNKNNRNVILKGHAKFTVKRNESMPFIIKSEQLTTQVLGTVFEIKDYGNGAQVFVHNGKVKVSNSASEIFLTHHQKAMYNPKSGLVKLEDSVWNSVGNSLSFQNATLATISQEIETITGKKLQIPANLLNEKFTGKFNNVAEVSSVCEVLSAAFNTTITVQ